ncbi:MAG: hypothetical protein HRT69_12025 [Flavobacteriaceae bacterium]|nr:hypothetical protein [Flavobacteriaceae bacterium]
MRKIFNKNIKISVSIISIFLIALISCDDVLEEDISDSNITVTAPLEGDTVVSNTVIFQWNSLNDADEYRVQVNNASNVIVLDSLVPTNSFTYPLIPGNYSWRVRGENFAYQTGYTFPVNFTMEALEDMTNQIVVLNTPSDNFYTNTSSGHTVTWTGITTADSYTLELDKDVLGVINTLDTFENLTAVTFDIDSSYLTDDAIYTWKIKALNVATDTETIYSTRTILLDTQAPGVATLESPSDDATENQSSPVVFDWTNEVDTGTVQSSITSVLEIASNSDFTIIEEVYPPSASTTKSHTFTNTGDYYWRVKNFDAAGNESSYTATRTVTII